MPHNRICFSPAASHTPTSARRASSKSPSVTRRMPCGEEHLAKTCPSALTLNARKLLVPQSTAIKAYAPGSSLLTQCNNCQVRRGARHGADPARDLLRGIILGLLGARVKYREAAFGTRSQDEIISRIRALWIGYIFRRRVVLRACFLGKMKLPQCLKAGRFQYLIDHLRRTSLGPGIVHDGHPRLNAIDQGMTGACVQGMMRHHQDVDVAQSIDRAHEQHFLSPGEIAKIENFQLAEIDQHTERMRIFAAIRGLGFGSAAVL